jgi:Ca2+:H+ antiporter
VRHAAIPWSVGSMMAGSLQSDNALVIETRLARHGTGVNSMTDHSASPRKPLRAAIDEWPLLFSVATTAAFLVFGARWLEDLGNPAWFAFMLLWPLITILLSAFCLVRHAESLAVKLGEPFGTLVLTLAVTGLEAMMISALMFYGPRESAVARDTMFAVIMIVLNGLVGLCLVLGGLRYREQTLNLYGANAFLAVILPLAVLVLVMPSFTTTTPDTSPSPLQSVFLIIMSVGLYCTFLALQTRWHREYFIVHVTAEMSSLAEDAEYHGVHDVRSVPYHVAFLIAYMLPVLILAKQLATPIDYGVEKLGAPAAIGGFTVAALILAPESMAAVRAALSNHLQRAMNLSLGSVVASISLTIPAVLTIGFVTDKTLLLGLDPVEMVLLALSLTVSIITFMLPLTNVLLGAVHLLMFLAYIMLMFDG